MSKSVLGIGLAIVGVALAFTPLGPALIAGGLAIAGTTVAFSTIVGLGLLIASSVLMGPAMPKMPGSLGNGGRERLYTSLDLRATRKILFGTTAGATDVRYQTYTGTDQEFMEMIVCVASHKVNSIYEIWLDNEKVWDSTSGAIGEYVGYLTVNTRTEATSGNGIGIDAVWTTSATLTGCAYFHARFKLTGPDDQTPGPFSSGVSQRMTVRCNGALTYDPRLDTTVAGGSGAHRPTDQTTWAWNANASRNPAIQLLFYLLGWKINGKLAVGMGLPAARIDMPSFITAANMCDESVTKSAANGGGTEPRYRTDGVLSESDDRSAIVETLCASMNAIVRDNGGKLSLTVLKNDLSVPVASFDDNDVLGAMEFDQTPDLSATFNITRGQRIDPSDTALYQPTDYTEVVIASLDGIDRIDSFDVPLVQSHGQAIRLAKQRLQRGQYQAKLRLNGKPKWWQVNLGEVISFSHQSFGWNGKLFRMAGQKISRGGETELILIEEHANIYAWDNSEAAPVNGGTPTIYDPNNSPILRGIISSGAIRKGNMLTDVLFSSKWTLTAGAVRRRSNATSGYARGVERFFLEMSPSTSAVVSALSEKVAVNPGQKYFFSIKAQRGTTLGSGSRLNMGGQWLGSDGVTVVGTFVEGTQQTPTLLTAGALPKEVSWSDTAPATAFFVQLKPYTPALASSSGTFRIEAPWISIVDAGGSPSVGFGPTSKTVNYSSGGTVEAGQLPSDLFYKMYLGGIEQTAGVTWTYKVTSGSVNAFTSASGVKTMTGTGTGTFTLNSLEQDSSTIEITATHSNGSVAKVAVSFYKKFAATTGVVGGGGATGDSPSQTSGFTTYNSNVFVVISNTLLYTVPTGKTTIDATVNLVHTPGGTATGSWAVEVKVQRLISGTWTDQGALLTGTSSVTFDGEVRETFEAGTVGTRSSTSLVAGTQYSYRLVARTTVAKSHSVTGSVSLASP